MRSTLKSLKKTVIGADRAAITKLVEKVHYQTLVVQCTCGVGYHQISSRLEPSKQCAGTGEK